MITTVASFVASCIVEVVFALPVAFFAATLSSTPCVTGCGSSSGSGVVMLSQKVACGVVGWTLVDLRLVAVVDVLLLRVVG